MGTSRLKAAPLHVAAVAMVNATLQLIVSFGVSITAQQNAAITGVVNALLLVISLFLQNGVAPVTVVHPQPTVETAPEPLPPLSTP